jgi:hypothetical protein
MSYPTENPEVVEDVLREVRVAMLKFPSWPVDPLHAVGVVNEEVGELSKAVLQQMYEPHKNKGGVHDVRKEAIQGAAMLLRFIAGLDRYDWVQGRQTRQESLER